MDIVNIQGLAADPPWFMMVRAECNLFERMQERRGDEVWVVKVFAQILEAVGFAHVNNVIHRDLKPQNILFIGDAPLVSDFGIGKDLTSPSTTLTPSGRPMGTYGYMAPEQFEDGKNVFPSADVYSLGKILAEMFSGRQPAFGTVRVEGVPLRYHQFIYRCCSQEPFRRYLSAADAHVAFRVVAAGAGVRIAQAFTE